MAKVQESFKYDDFELHECNRDVKKTAELEKSMRRYGWIDAFPAYVIKSPGGKMVIKAGHHRCTVARRIGLPIKYVLCEDIGISLYELEKPTVQWSLQDYLDSHARRGVTDYLKIKQYASHTGIPVGCLISMLGGNWAGSGNFIDTFKSGTFKIKTTDQVDVIADILEFMRKHKAPCAGTRLLVFALSKLLFLEEFNVEHFKKKIRLFPTLLVKQVNLKDYLQMIEDVYNRNTKNKINLAFLAEEAAKSRNVIINKNKEKLRSVGEHRAQLSAVATW